MRLPIVMRPAQREHLPAIRAINAESVPGVSLLSARDLNRITEAASIVVVALLNESVAGYSVGYAADAAYAGEEFQWFLCRGRDFLYVAQSLSRIEVEESAQRYIRSLRSSPSVTSSGRWCVR